MIVQLKKTKEYIHKVESDLKNNLEESKQELEIDFGSKLAKSEQKLCADFGSKLAESEQKMENTTDNLSNEIELLKNDGFGLLKNKTD